MSSQEWADLGHNENDAQAITLIGLFSIHLPGYWKGLIVLGGSVAPALRYANLPEDEKNENKRRIGLGF